VGNRKIAFASDRDGYGEIYTMNPDGSELNRFTFNSRDDSNLFPAWSPDGTKIAFSQDFYSAGGSGIYVMESDGANQKVITFGYQPAWSPDGSKLAFTNGLSIYSMTDDGRGLTQITEPPSGGIVGDWDFAPAWSPNGDQIAFTRFLNCNGLDDTCQALEICVANANGSGGRPLNNLATHLTYADDPAPCWSPDGATIVFSANKDLFAAASDGGDVANITNTNGANESHPSWPLLSARWQEDQTRRQATSAKIPTAQFHRSSHSPIPRMHATRTVTLSKSDTNHV